MGSTIATTRICRPCGRTAITSAVRMTAFSRLQPVPWARPCAGSLSGNCLARPDPVFQGKIEGSPLHMPKIGPWWRKKPLISWEKLGVDALNNYLIRSQTVRRLVGKVNFVVGGSCWWDLRHPVPPQETDYQALMRAFLRQAPGDLARRLGVPVVHAAQAGEFDGVRPGHSDLRDVS